MKFLKFNRALYLEAFLFLFFGLKKNVFCSKLNLLSFLVFPSKMIVLATVLFRHG